MKLALVSLGCDKNTVDSERMLAELVGHGAVPVEDPRQADIVLVNTCGFIDAAKEESIETLLRAAALKRSGTCRAVVAVGCMVARYRSEMIAELPEVDLFVGLRDVVRLVPELRARGLLDGPREHPGERLPLGGKRHVSYLKLSEGCDHGCAFCAIPLWRGKHRSFGVEALVAEAAALEARGTVELNLVAQDVAHYGRDLEGDADIVTLLRALLAGTSIPWIRLLYVYSAGLRPPLVELMAAEPRLLPYLDVPIQHASDRVLRRMRRPERQDSLRRKIGWLRESIPDLTLRTTVMVGFPGETERDFRILLDFMEEIRFDHLGAFAFSPQEGTRAAAMAEQVPEDVAAERLEELLAIQRAISAERLTEEVGRPRTAIVDRLEPGEFTDLSPCPPPVIAVGRLSGQADDVDGVTVLRSRTSLEPGQLVKVVVREVDDFDLRADVVDILSSRVHAPPSLPPARDRALPVVPLGLETTWGR
ncbi:MAG: 30S ribosomal protein S12 methylthiotransferase RimO [Gemmatimonadota bacterium]